MILTTPEQETIRQQPQSTRLNLIIYEPTEVMRCVVNDSTIAKGEQIIVYNTVSGGTYTSVEAGMTLLIGTTAGASDVGRIRIRSATSAHFKVSENSNIRWRDNLHLTVLNYWEIWPIFPRIIPDPADATNNLFYKDYDVAYSTQNTNLGTFINAGSHRARILTSGTTSVYWDASTSVNLKSQAMTYAWEFGGGAPSTYSGATPGNVVYSTPGNYVTKITATASSGAVDTSYRYVAIRDAIGSGNTPPIVKWEMKNFSGSRGEGGYQSQFTCYQTLNITDNAVVMLVADDYYGSSHVSMGGNTPNEPYMFFVGYVDKNTIKIDYRDSTTEFTAQSITGLMKQSLGFSVSVESKASPSTWYELIQMDCQRAMYHYLRWHSTVLKVTDFEFDGTDYYIQFFDADRTSMYDAIDELMRGALIGNVCADRQGKIWAEVEPMAYNNPTGTFTSGFTITRRDWIDEPAIEDVINDQVSYLEYGGILYKGSTIDTSRPMLSCAPGRTPSFRGIVDKEHPGLALGSQKQLNKLAGNVYANKNYQYPRISMRMSEGLRNFDVAPYLTNVAGINIQPSETVKNVEINGVYVPDSMTWDYDHTNGTLLPSIDWLGITTGVPGDTIKIIIPTDTGGDPEFPTVTTPPIPIVTVTSGTSSGVDPTMVVFVSSNFGVAYCTNFDEIAPVWLPMNDGLATGTYTQIGKIVKTLNNKLFILTDGSHSAGYTNIYWTDMSEVDDVTPPPAWALLRTADGITDVAFHALGVNPGAEEEIAVLGGVSYEWPGGQTQRFYLGDSSGLSQTLSFTSIKGYALGDIAYTPTGWYMVANNIAGFQGNDYQTVLWVINHAGSLAIDAYSSTTNPAMYLAGNSNWAVVSNGLSDFVLCWRPTHGSGSTGYGKIVGNATFEPFVVLPDPAGATSNYAHAMQQMAISPSGNCILAGHTVSSVVFGVPYRTYDQGTTWESVAGYVPIGMTVIENCGDDFRWITAGGTNMKYTTNFATPGSGENKEGNLSPDFPLVDIIYVKYIG